MFKACHKELGRDVISLDPSLTRLQLYAWADSHLLACPECKAEVGFRSGEIRRPHFFHRTRLDCSYNTEDPEVSAARAVLYSALVRKVALRGGEIDVEVRLEGAPKDDLVDVWVRFPCQPPIAYRIFKKGPRPTRLEVIMGVTKEHKAIPRNLLTISRRTWESEQSGIEPRLSIPAYDRHLFFHRSWDKYHSRLLPPPRSQCLTFIDPEQERLTC